jgi:hypothetical protein
MAENAIFSFICKGLTVVLKWCKIVIEWHKVDESGDKPTVRCITPILQNKSKIKANYPPTPRFRRGNKFKK